MRPLVMAMHPNPSRIVFTIMELNPTITVGSLFITPTRHSIIDHHTYIVGGVSVAANNFY